MQGLGSFMLRRAGTRTPDLLRVNKPRILFGFQFNPCVCIALRQFSAAAFAKCGTRLDAAHRLLEHFWIIWLGDVRQGPTTNLKGADVHAAEREFPPVTSSVSTPHRARSLANHPDSHCVRDGEAVFRLSGKMGIVGVPQRGKIDGGSTQHPTTGRPAKVGSIS